MSRYCPVMNRTITYLPCIECDEMWCQAFFCLVVGSKSFDDYEFLRNKLDYLLQNKEKIVIVSGGDGKTKLLAERYASERNYFCKIYETMRKRNGKVIERIADREMHEYTARQRSRGEVVFWDGISSEAKESFRLAKEFRTPVRVIKFKEEKKNV